MPVFVDTTQEESVQNGIDDMSVILSETFDCGLNKAFDAEQVLSD